jgi:hypothetical protein
MAYTTINKSSEHFNTKLYTGNGSTNAITGVGFQPDMCWWKMRSGVEEHALGDAVRGATKIIKPNATSAEATSSSYFTSFDSDGFTLGNDSKTNTNSSTYASWNWKANGAGVSNTDGSITSTVSPNTTSGFSVVNYTGTNAIASVGHGLGVKPAMIIAKNVTTPGEDWAVYHKSLGGYQYYLKLNGDTAVSTATNRWNAEPDISVFNVGAVGETNGSGTNQIAYVFVEKKGYSKFGSYTGNGNADGTFVYTGFSPAFVIIKRTDTSDIWSIVDNKQANPYPNPNVQMLVANTNGADNSSVSPFIDILSNGFKLRGTWTGVNASGGTYIYMAFAEQPLVGTNNIPAKAR